MWFLCSVRLVPTNLQWTQGKVFPELGELVDEEGELDVLDGISPSEPGVRSDWYAGRRLGVTDQLKIVINNCSGCFQAYFFCCDESRDSTLAAASVTFVCGKRGLGPKGHRFNPGMRGAGGERLLSSWKRRH